MFGFFQDYNRRQFALSMIEDSKTEVASDSSSSQCSQSDDAKRKTWDAEKSGLCQLLPDPGGLVVVFSSFDRLSLHLLPAGEDLPLPFP